MLGSKLRKIHFLFTIVFALWCLPAQAGAFSPSELKFLQNFIAKSWDGARSTRLPDTFKQLTREFRGAGGRLGDDLEMVLQKGSYVSWQGSALRTYRPYLLLQRGLYTEQAQAVEKLWITIIAPQNVVNREAVRVLKANHLVFGQPAFEYWFRSMIGSLTQKNPLFRMKCLQVPYSPFINPKDYKPIMKWREKMADRAISNIETISIKDRDYFMMHFPISPEDELPAVMAFLKKLSKSEILLNK